MALAARPAPPAAELITLSEATRIVGVHRDTVRAWCVRGDIASIRYGPRHQLHLRRADLDVLITEREGRLGQEGQPVSATTTAPAPAHDTSHAAGNGHAHPTGGTLRPLRPLRATSASSTDALRRLASELSSTDALQPVLEQVLENAERLFHADRAGLWLWHPTREHPLELVAKRDFPEAIEATVTAATHGSNLAGFESLRRSEVIVYRDAADPALTPEMRQLYADNGIASLCFVPAKYVITSKLTPIRVDYCDRL